jgi:hypothetical protein
MMTRVTSSLQDNIEVSQLRKIKDRFVQTMYNNPDVFKANSVMQIISRMKKQAAEENSDNFAADSSPRELNRKGNHCGLAKHVSKD